MHRDEEATLKTLTAYRGIIGGLIERHDGRVFNTDAASLTEIETIPVGKSPTNSIFGADGRHAYVANWGSDTVSVIDVVDWREAKSIAVGRRPFAIYLFNPARGEITGNR